MEPINSKIKRRKGGTGYHGSILAASALSLDAKQERNRCFQSDKGAMLLSHVSLARMSVMIDETREMQGSASRP